LFPGNERDCLVALDRFPEFVESGEDVGPLVHGFELAQDGFDLPRVPAARQTKSVQVFLLPVVMIGCANE